MQNWYKNKTSKRIFLVIITFFTLCTFCVDLIVNVDEDNGVLAFFEMCIKSFHGYSVIYIPLFIAFYFLYSKWYFDGKKVNKVAFILAIFFSMALIVGVYYRKMGSLIYMITLKFQLFKTIIIFLGYYSMIYIILKKIYDWLDSYGKENQNYKKKSKITEFIFEKHAFILPILIIFFMWLPYIIAFYPGVVVHKDIKNEIYQFHNMDNMLTDEVNLLSEDVYITTHHPVFHALIINGFVKLGELIHNYNLAMFLYTIIQVIATLSVIGYTFILMKKMNMPIWVRYISIFIYCFLSYIPLAAINFSKDTYSTIFTMAFILLLFNCTIDEEKLKKKSFVCLLIIVMICMMLFRNDGIYRCILPFIVFIIINKNKWRKLTSIMLIPLCFFGIYSKIILPAFNITNGSIKEIFSIPFQQTARVAYLYGETAYSEEDIEKINKVLDYEVIKKEYDPNSADPVKATFNKNATKEEIKDYFKIWIKNLSKYPFTYIEATLNNTFGYFDFNTLSNIGYTYESDLMDGIFDIGFIDRWKGIRNYIEIGHLIIRQLPVIGTLYSLAFHINFTLIAIGYLINSRKNKYIPVLLPLIITLLIAMAGPINAYERYTLPIIFSLPITMTIILYVAKQKES